LVPTRPPGTPTQGPSWRYLKVNFSETLSIFGDKCPQNGSKNEQTAPRTKTGYPHIGPFVVNRLTSRIHLELSVWMVRSTLPYPTYNLWRMNLWSHQPEVARGHHKGYFISQKSPQRLRRSPSPLAAWTPCLRILKYTR